MKINAKLLLISLASAFSATAADEEIPVCIDTFRDLCGSSSSSSDACFDCARNNAGALEEAGCTRFMIQRACRKVDDENISECRTAVEDICPKSDYIVSRDCMECAQANVDDILASGCTVSAVGAVCKERTGQDIPVIVPETVLPTGATEENPLRVFLQAGQSGCVGQADVSMMNEDPNYEDLQGVQEGVWFAGIKQGYSKSATDPSHFYMGPMLAGEASKNDNAMGPEVAIGRRLYDADNSGAPVLVVKYCWGGSNLAVEWNPNSPFNSWDKEEDDGTAEWLLEETGEGGAELGNKKHLYGNLIYTVRRTLELLDDADIPYVLSGMFWLQGAADKKRTWSEYGNDTVNFFEAVRTELDAPFLPIVDEGGVYDNINTGKTYAASVIEGCNMVVPMMAMASPDPDDTECVPGPSNACTETTFINFELFDYFGYDPVLNTPEYAALKPPGSSNETFYWFRSFPNNQHMEYEGKILQARLMANAYIQSFTTDSLTDEWIEEDAAIQFPYLPCDPDVNGGEPGPDNICWMDQREEADYAEATCSGAYDVFEPFELRGSSTTSLSMSLSSGTTIRSSWATMALSTFFSAYVLVFAMA